MEEGAPPEVPESLAYTRTRGVGVLDRLSRWLVQGPGLLLLFFLAFVFSIAKEPEIGLNLLGILLTLWVVSPLLGKRPLAHPWRLTALRLPATLMLSVSVVVVRCGIENVELSKDPIVYFTRVGLDVVEKATEPKVVVWTAVAALGLLALGRFLAARNPWLELSASPPRGRKIASLLILGLIFGSLATVPIAAKLAWSQPYLRTRKLTDTIVKLRTERLKSGRYPEQVENLPVAVHYISGSSTATVIDEMNVVEIKLL